MKKVMKFTTVIALMFVAAQSIASSPKLNLTPNTAKSLSLTLNAANQETIIRLSDVEGHTIFSEDIERQEMFSKRFDLSKLEKGTFLFTVENKLKEIVFTIELNDVIVKIIDRTENAKPVFRKGKGSVFLNLLNLDKKDVRIKVYDSSDLVVFEETIANTTLVEKVFNFEKAFEGSYTIMVQDATNSYYEVVVVK